MKNFFKVVVLFLSINLYANPTNALYLELGFGVALEDSVQTQTGFEYTYERQYLLDAMLGFQYGLYRVELEQSWQKDDLYSHGRGKSEGDFIQKSQMFNLFYSGYNKSNFLTSIGFGVGMSSIELDDSYTKRIKNDNIFTAQGILSIGYKMGENLVLAPKYTLKYLEKSDDFEAKYNHQILFSIRYLFN